MLFQALPPFVLLLTAIEACSVTMWDNDGFRGPSWWRVNGPQSHANVWRHDVISSIKVEGPPGCRATFWEHPNFRGWAKTLDPGSYNKHELGRRGIKNDQISSMKLVNLCDNWGCTCQGFSDAYGTYPGNWVVANGATERAWWLHYNCNTSPTKLCTIWGCTCQGFSDYYGTDHGVSWADADHADPPGTYFDGSSNRKHTSNDLRYWWQTVKKCTTSPNNRCSAKHCNGQWKIKSRGTKCNGACPVNTNMCCKIDNCDKVRVVGTSFKETDIYVGEPQVKQLSAYTVDGENCGVSQEKPLDSFVRTKTVSITHEESLELGASLESTFGWSKSHESTIEWSESASMSMDMPLGKAAGIGVEQSMTKTWSKTSSFAQDGGVTKGSNTNKVTGRSKQVTEEIQFTGISTAVPAYAWHRHKAYYHERPVHLTLELTVQCIIGGRNVMEKKIPGTKIITATESHLKFEPMEDLTSACKTTHTEYGTCTCFPGLRSNFHTSTGCQARMKPDGTPSNKKGCYVYKDAGCTDAIGLQDANPAQYIGDPELVRKLSLDYPLDGSMFRWSSVPCYDCSSFGCTCQGFSEKWGTNAGVTWGTADKEPEFNALRDWWNTKKCKTTPTKACEVAEGTNWFGPNGNQDLPNMPIRNVGSVASCSQSCTSTIGCEYFAYDHQGRKCWLKKNFQRVDLDPNMTSGPKCPVGRRRISGNNEGGADNSNSLPAPLNV